MENPISGIQDTVTYFDTVPTWDRLTDDELTESLKEELQNASLRWRKAGGIYSKAPEISFYSPFKLKVHSKFAFKLTIYPSQYRKDYKLLLNSIAWVSLLPCSHTLCHLQKARITQVSQADSPEQLGLEVCGQSCLT